MKKAEGYPQPMGASRRDDKMNFAVAVPSGKTCELLLYSKGKQEPIQRFDMPEEEGIGEVRFLAVTGFREDRYEYNFCIDGRVCVDPCVREVSRTRKFGVNPDLEAHQMRGRVPVNSYDWEGDRYPKIPLNEVVAYSLHVRGFTRHASSKVKHRGTFAGIVEKLPYLKELGVNQIHCMPVYEFDEIVGKRTNYWGYGKGYYFAPKMSYSVSGKPCTELKDMVKACHREGVEVVLEMPFSEGIRSHTAAECLRYYMLEYHIDGFVVNPYVVSWDCLKNDPILKGAKIFQKDNSFQNVMRRFLKGDEGMVGDVIWALRRNTAEDGKFNYITTHTGFTMSDLVSYDAKHNEANGERNQDGPDYNYSWNCGTEGPTRKKNISMLRKKQIRNAFLLLLAAQGTPCILAGDEFGNTQKGNNNVYCQDNETAWLDWNRLKKDDSLFQYVKGLLAMRKANTALHRPEALFGADKNACGIPDVSYHGEDAWQAPTQVSSRQLGVLYSAAAPGENECFIAYNMHWMEHSFALPVLPGHKEWHKVLDTADPKERIEAEHGGENAAVKDRSVVIGERSIVMFEGVAGPESEIKKSRHGRAAKRKTEIVKPEI